MSIFVVVPILTKALNMHFFIASSTVTSSFPASFSLLASLISPTSTVRLYVVSIASILACNSHMSLSTAGSGIFLSLLLDIYLSSTGSGIFLSLLLGIYLSSIGSGNCMSLLLGGMVLKFSPFSLL
jgi:hypothetical protein